MELKDKYTQLKVEDERLDKIQRKRLKKDLCIFECSTAPEEGIFARDEQYWITKTALRLNAIRECIFYGENRKFTPDFVIEILAKYGYTESEIAKVQEVISSKSLEGRADN